MNKNFEGAYGTFCVGLGSQKVLNWENNMLLCLFSFVSEILFFTFYNAYWNVKIAYPVNKTIEKNNWAESIWVLKLAKNEVLIESEKTWIERLM